MQNLHKVVEQAKAAGIEVKQFCTYCPKSATGELQMDDGEGNTFPLPICEGCVGILQARYPDKFA